MQSEVLIPAIVFFSIVAVVKILADAKTRNRLIEKGVADEKIRDFLGATSQLHALSSLKWGMVLVGIGLAAVIGEAFPSYVSDEITWALIFIFAGIAFLVYYPLADRRLKQAQDKLNHPPDGR